MSKSNSYVIDFTRVKKWDDIPEIISKELNFPKWYGFSLDILDEFLTDMVLTEKSSVEIRGLEKLKEYNGYDRKIYEVFLSAKHSYGTTHAKNLQVKIIHEGGIIEILPDELERRNIILDFSDIATEEGVIEAFIRAFELDAESTESLDDVWHFLLLNLTLRISVVEVRGIERLRSIGNTYGSVLKILSSLKEAWNGEYSNRFFYTFSNSEN